METEESESTNEETSSLDNIANQKRKRSSSLNNTTRKKRRAPVRDYLESTPTGGNKCKICRQIFSKLTAIATIDRHFQKFHPSYFIKIKQRKLSELNPYNSNDKLRVDSLGDASNLT